MAFILFGSFNNNEIIDYLQLYIRFQDQYIFSMRKKSKKMSFLPEVTNNSFVRSQSSLDQTPHLPVSNLQRFQSQLQKRLSQGRTTPFRQTKRSTINKQSFNQLEPIVLKNISSLTKDVNNIKQQIKRKNKHKQLRKLDILSRMMTQVEDRNRYHSYNSNNNNSPVYCPMPIPYYIPMPMMSQSPLGYDHYQSQSQSQSQSSKKRSIVIDNRRNMRKWRKVVHCILFTLYLKRFCRLIQSNRRQNFKKMLPKIKTNLMYIRSNIVKAISTDFLSIIYSKKDVSFDFTEETTSRILKEKLTSIRKLIKILIQNIFSGLKRFGKSSELVETIYYLCRHGNYSCTEPLLTKQQMQLSCISNSFHYISADSTLEKVNLINLFFIKLLIYNTLLSPQKINDNLLEEEIPKNLFIISSVLYEFIIDIQDQYMMGLNPIYQIGNYAKNNKVRYLEALKYKTQEEVEGELISGLLRENVVSEYFKFKLWTEQSQMIKEILNFLQNLMSTYHSNSQKKFF